MQDFDEMLTDAVLHCDTTAIRAEVERLTTELAEMTNRRAVWEAMYHEAHEWQRQAEAREAALRAITGEMRAERSWQYRPLPGVWMLAEWDRRAGKIR